ncbi:hypothetical protein DPMN_066549 [Dreissena polymorpha]|uniref:Uncharacterized protein n=1 Tax=Dreissena polymorpha TaxID=45954 RepID=A0A9D3YVP0_DREPO|nr:hypothetical protein DPMN_066549 [Dreissena polymorpha]
MTTTPLFSSVENPSPTWESLMTVTSPLVNLQISLTDSMEEQEHTGWRSARRFRRGESTINTSTDITMNGKKLEEVTSSKCLDATLSKDGTRTAEV